MARLIKPEKNIIIGEVAVIPLLQGKYIIIDAEDLHLVENDRWSCCNSSGRTVYAFRNKNKINKKMPYIHRIIMGISDPNIFIDHIDRNGLNNRKSNLRICNRSENGRNKIGARNVTSEYKGVCFDRFSNRWYAQIKTNKVVNLGRFKDEKLAAIAYDIAALKYHGEFACTNFLKKGTAV